MAEPKRFLITGGAGFIGSNAARRFAELGHAVVVFDNLSRAAAPFNLRWLQGLHPEIRFVQGDVQSEADVAGVLAEPFDAVIHLAGQVAVTTSIVDPAADYGSNLLGTFRLLEGVRARYGSRPETAPLFLYASTNKVYGHIAGGEVLREGRWDLTEVSEGVGEEETLSFESPYGCSKGAADQYVVDYHRSFGLPTVSFRQSCLAADQPVLTPFGNKPISALRPGDLVHSGGGWTRVRHVWKTGVKPVRRLRTLNGLSIVVTPDHRVRRPHGLFDNAGFAYGDYLAVLPEALHAPAWESVPDTVLEPDAFLTAVGERTSDPRCLTEADRIAAELLPLTGDRLLAVTEVAGRLFGDGHLSICRREARQNPSYQVQHYGSLEELSDLSQWLGWLGLPASAVVGSATTSTLPNGHIVRGTTFRIQQQTIPIFTLFEQLGVPVGDKVRVAYTVPDWVIRGHRMVKRAFLRGFFGAELGRVCATSHLAPSFAQSKDVEFLEDGRAFVRQLRQLLEEFGIETSYFEEKPTTYQKGTTVQMTVRLLGGYRLYPKLAAIGYAFAGERSQHLNTLMRWSWTQTAPEHFEKTSELYRADGQLSWDSIGQIEDLGETDVYDLEVENRSHMFVAGGVQVSNCIYGPRQFGEEDQGWVAWFALAAEFRLPIVIYGDGLQVRDLLWVDDLIAAYLAAVSRKERVAGRAYNIGGGRPFRLSLQELLRMLEGRFQRAIPVGHAPQRLGDQRVFYCDISRARRELEWEPRVSPAEGVGRLLDWIGANRDEIASYLAGKGIPVAAS